MGRALAELGIEWIGARSPQAKGRIERHFDTAQDRLVKGLRKAGVHSLEGANQYLETRFLPWVNEHLTRPPANPVDAHRPLGKEHDLAAILSQVDQRVVGNDYTLRLQGCLYRIARRQIRPGLRGSVVRVEQRLDGTLAVRFRQHYLAIEPCAAAPPPQRKARPKPAARQATGERSAGWKSQPFDLHSGLKVWQAAQESGARHDPESTW
jgi:hypothetical protein